MEDFEELYKIYSEKIWAYIYYRVGGDPTATSELLERVFALAHEQWPFDSSIPAQARLYRLAYHCIIEPNRSDDAQS